MKFEVKNYRKIPDIECLEDVIAVSKKTGRRTVSYEEYLKYGKYHYGTLLKKFGAWNKVLKKAGLEFSKRRSRWENDADKEEDLFENLTRVSTKLRRQPKYKEMETPLSLYSGSVYVRHFDTWMAALTAFGAYKKNGAASVDGSANRKAANRQKKDTTEPSGRERDKRYPSLRLKFKVFARDSYRCTCCGKSPATHPGVVLHCDHIEPWSRGGRTIFENLTTLCSECNIGKGDMTAEEFLTSHQVVQKGN